MGKRITGIAVALLLAGMSAVSAYAEGQNLSGTETGIEQVSLNLPEAVVYGNGFTAADAGQAKGFIGTEELALLQAGTFADSGIGMEYDVLLDVSGSIPNSYLNGIKAGVLNLQKSLRPEDTLVLGTIGETVTLAADGSQDASSMEQILNGLGKNAQRTLLYEAIDQMTKLEDAKNNGKRRVLFVVSDGEDDANAGDRQSEEALNTLQRAGVPAYAICIKDTKKENVDSFGAFARTTGGRLVTITPESAPGALTELSGQLLNSTCLKFSAPNNRITNQQEIFKLELKDGKTLTKDVMNIHSISDTIAPTIVTAQQNGENQIDLVFSEAMDGIEQAANYQVTLDGELHAVGSVTNQNAENTKVTLTMQDRLDNGTYEISCTNITDQSMEKNILSETKTCEVSGIEAATGAETADTGAAAALAAVGILLFLALVVLIIVIASKNSKKKKEEQARILEEAAPVDHQVILTGDAMKQHISMPVRQLYVSISAAGAYPESTVWKIQSSLMVGRDRRTCDIFIDDKKMSKQHFALTLENNLFFVEDLHSTNGTSVNGIRINTRRKLESGDVISAGSMTFAIRF